MFPLSRELYGSRTNGAVPCFTEGHLLTRSFVAFYVASENDILFFCESGEVISPRLG